MDNKILSPAELGIINYYPLKVIIIYYPLFSMKPYWVYPVCVTIDGYKISSNVEVAPEVQRIRQ